MALTGWVLGSATDENSAPDQYWGGTGFVPDLNNAQFFSSATNTVQQARVEEGALQARFATQDIRLLAAQQSVTVAPDSDTGNGWIYGSAPDEGSATDQYWSGSQFESDLNSAEIFSKAEGTTIESARQEEGRFQQRFSDVDLRLIPATGAISLV